MQAHKEGFDKIEVRRASLGSGPTGPWTPCSMICGDGMREQGSQVRGSCGPILGKK